MKKKLIGIRGLIAASISALLVVIGISGGAISTAQADDGATVIKQFGCVLVAADNGLGITLFTNDVTHYVGTPSGNASLQCHFDIPAGFEPAKTMRFDGFTCGTFMGTTTNSQSVVTKGGKAHLRCQIKANN